MRRRRPLVGLALFVFTFPILAQPAQGLRPKRGAAAPGGDAEDAKEDPEKKMPGMVKDELPYFEPSLTPWSPLPPGLSFEDLMDRFLDAKNLNELGPDYQAIATPDWDQQYLILGELWKMNVLGGRPTR